MTFRLHWIDLLSAGYLFIAVFQGLATQKRLADSASERKEAMDAIEAMGNLKHTLGEGWTPEMEANAESFKNLEAAKAFLSWWGPHVFGVSLVAAILAVLIGITSVPGCVLGFCLSSPRATLYTINAVFGGRKRGKN